MYHACPKPRKYTQILKIDDSNYTHALLNRRYSSISSNKELALSQAMSSKACAMGAGLQWETHIVPGW